MLLVKTRNNHDNFYILLEIKHSDNYLSGFYGLKPDSAQQQAYLIEHRPEIPNTLIRLNCGTILQTDILLCGFKSNKIKQKLE